MRLILLLVQATIPAPIVFDLAKLAPTRTAGCGAGQGGDIVVCARATAPDQRIGAALPGAPEGMPQAEVRVFGNARLSVDARQATVGGFTTNRAMVHLKIPF